MITLFAAVAAGCGGAQVNTGNGEGSVHTVGVDEFALIISDQHSVWPRRGCWLIDVRTAEEFAQGHIEGADNIDVNLPDFDGRTEGFPACGTGCVVVYCRGGKRSLKAANMLAKRGAEVYNLDGGILAWQKAGRPTVTDETDVFTTPGGKTVKIHALMHSSMRIEYDGHEIEVDPCSNLHGRTVDYSALPKADIILVTHEHFDHYDTTALRLLSTANTQLIMNSRCVELFGGGTAINNGERLQPTSDITIEAVPAYNTTEGHKDFHPKGRDNGYILTLDGLRIYIAGDTEDIPELAALKDIEIAFLPCNQPYTMTPQQLVKAARTISPKVLFPYHYGETDVSVIDHELQHDDIDLRIRHYE